MRSRGWRPVLLSLFLHLSTCQPPTRGTSGIPWTDFFHSFHFIQLQYFPLDQAPRQCWLINYMILFILTFFLHCHESCSNVVEIIWLCCSKFSANTFHQIFISLIVYWSLNWKHKTKIIIESQKVYDISKLGVICK